MSADRLDVLLVTPDYPPTTGGIQRLLHNITRNMPAAQVHVLTIEVAGARDFDRSIRQTTTRVAVPRSKRPAVRHALFNAMAAMERQTLTPDVVLNGHVVTAPLARLLARRHKVPCVLYAYGKELDGRPSLARWAMRHSDAAIAISQFTRDKLCSLSDRPTAPIYVVTPGVDIVTAPTRPVGERPTMVTTARLHDWYKGHDKILDALPRIRATVPDLLWVVIGDGRLKLELEAQAVAMGVADSVEFLGEVSDERRDEWLARADVFIMPSRYPKDGVGGEGFGIVYLEAAMSAVPSIASNVGAPTEVVADRSTGLLVDPEDQDAIATAVIECFTHRERTAEWGRSARKRAIAEFSWQKVGGELERALRAVVGAAGAGAGAAHLRSDMEGTKDWGSEWPA